MKGLAQGAGGRGSPEAGRRRDRGAVVWELGSLGASPCSPGTDESAGGGRRVRCMWRARGRGSGGAEESTLHNRPVTSTRAGPWGPAGRCWRQVLSEHRRQAPGRVVMETNCARGQGQGPAQRGPFFLLRFQHVAAQCFLTASGDHAVFIVRPFFPSPQPWGTVLFRPGVLWGLPCLLLGLPRVA